MKYPFVEAKVLKIWDESLTVKRFLLEFSLDYPFEYTPGQFIVMKLITEHGPELRSYSIASAPSRNNRFELIIGLNNTGATTPLLFHEFHEGMNIHISGPYGRFILPPILNHEICFVATGTGIAPLRGMIQFIFQNKIPHQKISLIFGNRTIKDILRAEEFQNLSRNEKSFSFIPVLSKEKSREWIGKTGHVHTVYKELFQDARPAIFYLCGWKEMIAEARENLLKIGYSRDVIHSEKYD